MQSKKMFRFLSIMLSVCWIEMALHGDIASPQGWCSSLYLFPVSPLLHGGIPSFALCPSARLPAPATMSQHFGSATEAALSSSPWRQGFTPHCPTNGCDSGGPRPIHRRSDRGISRQLYEGSFSGSEPNTTCTRPRESPIFVGIRRWDRPHTVSRMLRWPRSCR